MDENACFHTGIFIHDAVCLLHSRVEDTDAFDVAAIGDRADDGQDPVCLVRYIRVDLLLFSQRCPGPRRLYRRAS